MEQTLGQWFARMREDAGLTQMELAERMQVTQSVVSRIEADKQEPTARVCIAFARAISFPIEVVLRRAGYIEDGEIDKPPEDEAVDEFRWRLARVSDKGAREMALATIWSVLDTAAKQRPKQRER